MNLFPLHDFLEMLHTLIPQRFGRYIPNKFFFVKVKNSNFGGAKNLPH